jgi:glycosyltransferase involved in cell wall biosynthesis
MTVFNEERHLPSTIESVLNQSFRNFKLIISDNHSTDASPQIIEQFVKNDSRIVKVSPKNHCPSLVHGQFIFNEVLPQYTNKYSINIGGHDLWDSTYLENLYIKAESDPTVSVVYGDGFDLSYEKNEIYGKFEDHVVCSTIIKPLIPLVMLLSLQVNIISYGLIVEAKRKKVRFDRHACVGADHFFATELALHGKILHEPAAKFFLRRSKDHGSLSAYAERHLIKSNQLENSHQDFYKQLEWALYLLDLAVSDPDLAFYRLPEIKNMLKTSLINGYIIRYLPNLNIPNSDGLRTFLISPGMVSIYDVNSATINFVEQLISSNLEN